MIVGPCVRVDGEALEQTHTAQATPAALRTVQGAEAALPKRLLGALTGVAPSVVCVCVCVCVCVKRPVCLGGGSR